MQVTSANYGENGSVRPKSGLLASATPLPENAPKVHHNRYYELKMNTLVTFLNIFCMSSPPPHPPQKKLKKLTLQDVSMAGNYFVCLFGPNLFSPLRGTMKAEMKVPCTENPELSKVLL